MKDKHISFFYTAFNDVNYDMNDNNYALSILGNQTFTKCLLWHFRNKFPFLNEEVLTKIANKQVENRSVAKYFDDTYHIWDFISCDNSQREFLKNNPEKIHIKLDIIQKVFDALCASVEIILDSHYPIGVGYAHAHQIIVHSLNQMKISYKHEDIYDRVGILNDIKSSVRNKLGGDIKYEDEEVYLNQEKMYKVSVYFVKYNNKKLIGESTAHVKADAKEAAARQAFDEIQKMGFHYFIPEVFKRLEREL